jgi:hypothetical protein
MTITKRFGESYRHDVKEAIPPDRCEVCGEKLEIDPEGGEGHCPVCEEPEE